MLALVAVVLVARALPPAEYGDYAFAVAALGLAVLPALSGLDQLAVRELGVAFHEANWARAQAFMGWSARRLWAHSAIVVLAGGLVIAFLPMPPSARAAAWILLTAAPLLAYTRLARGQFQAIDRAARGLFFEQTFVNVGLVALALAVLAIPATRDALLVSVGHVAVLALACLVAVLAFPRLSPAEEGASVDSSHWAKSNWVFALVGALSVLHTNGYVLLAGILHDATMTALLSVAIRIAFVVKVFLGPIQMVAAPRIARAWRAGDLQAVSRESQSTARMGTLLCLPLVLVFLFLPGSFLGFIGSDYVGAVPALRLLAIGQLSLVVTGPAAVVQAMSGQEKASAVAIGVSFIIGAALGVALALKYGLTGMALGASLGLVLQALWSSISLWRSHGIWTGAIPIPVRRTAVGHG